MKRNPIRLNDPEDRFYRSSRPLSITPRSLSDDSVFAVRIPEDPRGVNRNFSTVKVSDPRKPIVKSVNNNKKITISRVLFSKLNSRLWEYSRTTIENGIFDT